MAKKWKFLRIKMAKPWKFLHKMISACTIRIVIPSNWTTLFVHGTHSFTFVDNKCQTDYVYVVISHGFDKKTAKSCKFLHRMISACTIRIVIPSNWTKLFVHGTHSFTFVVNKCQTDYVYVVISHASWLEIKTATSWKFLHRMISSSNIPVAISSDLIFYMKYD